MTSSHWSWGYIMSLGQTHCSTLMTKHTVKDNNVTTEYSGVSLKCLVISNSQKFVNNFRIIIVKFDDWINCKEQTVTADLETRSSDSIKIEYTEVTN